MKLFQTNSIEIVRACQESFGFEVPSVLLKKVYGKIRDVFSCVKFMFITCDKKIVNILTVALYLSVVKVIASLCILHCILSTIHWWIKMNINKQKCRVYYNNCVKTCCWRLNILINAEDLINHVNNSSVKLNSHLVTHSARSPRHSLHLHT